MKKMPIPAKLGWIERAVATHNFHAGQVKVDNSWTLSDTATALNRALGSISEDLLIVSWLKTHEARLRSFRYQRDAVTYIRELKRKIRMQEFE